MTIISIFLYHYETYFNIDKSLKKNEFPTIFFFKNHKKKTQKKFNQIWTIILVIMTIKTITRYK